MDKINTVARDFGRHLAIAKVNQGQAKEVIHQMAFTFYKTKRKRRQWRMVANNEFEMVAKNVAERTCIICVKG